MCVRSATDQLRAIVEVLHGQLEGARARTINQLLDHDEPQLAFECLCDTISTGQASVANETFLELQAVGRALRVPPDVWGQVRSSVR